MLGQSFPQASLSLQFAGSPGCDVVLAEGRHPVERGTGAGRQTSSQTSRGETDALGSLHGPTGSQCSPPASPGRPGEDVQLHRPGGGAGGTPRGQEASVQIEL